uniref:Putative secreted protein n=1 Tax=Anopheles triannulatus TaxID=58253 RepID=A0A2M4B2Z2_9DIPT
MDDSSLLLSTELACCFLAAAEGALATIRPAMSIQWQSLLRSTSGRTGSSATRHSKTISSRSTFLPVIFWIGGKGTGSVTVWSNISRGVSRKNAFVMAPLCGRTRSSWRVGMCQTITRSSSLPDSSVSLSIDTERQVMAFLWPLSVLSFSIGCDRCTSFERGNESRWHT